MPHTRARRLLVLVLVTLLVQAGYVPAGTPANPGKPYQYTLPEATDDGWETAHVSREHLDAGRLKALFERILDGTYQNIHSVLLVRNDKLVVEEYFQHWDGDAESRALMRGLDRVTPHAQHSVTKSVTSLLIGIAIDQQLIRGVDAQIAAFFPAYADLFADRAKADLRLHHFLAMSALAWDESTYPYTDARNDHAMMDRRQDPIRYVLAKPVLSAPGTQFVYNSGLAIALGKIIGNVSGMRADTFAERYLFTPLGISNYSWWTYPNGTVQTGGGLSLPPRDMAKLGALMLHSGRWQSQQIVSAAWVKDVTTPHISTGLPPQWVAPAYGYQWWLGAFRVGEREIASYSARGRGGQFIVVFPELQLVAVFTGWNDNALWLQPVEMLQRYILPAVE
jgi:CubicO group peptidase (beta-lactamase class C family)